MKYKNCCLPRLFYIIHFKKEGIVNCFENSITRQRFEEIPGNRVHVIISLCYIYLYGTVILST